MLQSLRVKNLAIVEDIRADFDRGLNVITGETGAGKSIIAEALGLLLGERADKTMIRAGEDTCGVEASFRLADSAEIDTILEELGIEPCEDGALIIRRLISASGQGRIIVNDCPATLQVLKRIGDLLVDLHGPHDHQSLLNPDFQVDLLDSFGHLWKTRTVYEDAYRALLDQKSRLASLEGSQDSVPQQIDLLSFQVRELEQAQLTDADDTDLGQEHTTVAHAARILELASVLRGALTEQESCAYNALVSCQGALTELARLLPAAADWQKDLESTVIQVQELADTISRAVAGIEHDPGRLQWLEDRMALLHRLKRKYGATVADMRSFLDQARIRLQSLQSRGEALAAATAAVEDARKKVESTGRKLGAERRRVADALAEAITRELRSLGFPHGAFSVQLAPAEPGPSGIDAVDFGFAPNVGEPSRPLRAIASSGEISRVMLAVKAVLATHDRIPVLVFDEIDANLGGEMGNSVGAKLKAVAGHHQVICITHLPQVAVHGATHFVVAKSVHDARTRTEITPAKGEARVEEIARMLGGRDLTSVTLKHAREMLRNA